MPANPVANDLTLEELNLLKNITTKAISDIPNIRGEKAGFGKPSAEGGAEWRSHFVTGAGLRGGIVSILHLLRQLRLYALAQRLVPFHLPASERELRRWNALGEAYTALLEIKHADNLQAARKLAGDTTNRVREYCRLP